MSVYLIKPLEKKSIVYHVEMFRENADGSTSWFNIDETFRWGQGFIEGDMEINLPYLEDKVAYCKTQPGWGCEFDDTISVDFEFSDDLNERDREEIRQCYLYGDVNDDENRSGPAWLFDGEHDWQEEDSSVEIIAPFQISLCEDDGTVIEENVELKPRPAPSTSWPFSQDFPKPETPEDHAKKNGLEL